MFMCANEKEGLIFRVNVCRCDLASVGGSLQDEHITYS